MAILADYIKPGLKVPRSVNLERDISSISLLDDYFVGQKSCEVLQRFLDSIDIQDTKAWSLIGPYGMGKSSFLNFLNALLGPADDPRTIKAREKLELYQPELSKSLSKKVNRLTGALGFNRIVVTASYEPINFTIQRALKHSTGEITNLIISGQPSKKSEFKTADDLLLVFNNIKTVTNRPVAFIIDEFGKNLEFLAHHPDEGDLFVLQKLAETEGIYIWVSLHQNFADYMSGLTLSQKKEWTKVQGRFEEISFVESHQLMLSLTRKALRHEKNSDIDERIEQWAEGAFNAYISLKAKDNSLDLTCETAAGLYPLHPITVTALLELCRSYAQYDRTLIQFLTGSDSSALPNFLLNASIGEDETMPVVGLDNLYDYFFQSSSKNMYIGRPEEQRLLEIDYRIKSGEYLDSISKKVLKSIGVLNLIGGRIGFKANFETLLELIAKTQDIPEPEFHKILSALIGSGFLLYREYSDEYVMWEGSDIDIGEEIRNIKPHLALEELDSLLNRYVELPPVVASRHSYETGTVRRFERRWLNIDKVDETIKPQNGFDGLILYSFGYLENPDKLPQVCADGRPLLIGHLHNWYVLKELVLELAAAHYVEDNNYKLTNDGVARRELRYRIASAEKALQGYITQTFFEVNKEVKWLAGGKEQRLRNSRELSSLLSDLCDKAYYKCPVIKNELINYTNLSSTAARARRELVEAMATRSTEEELGFTGWGPERAIYRSLLLATGLHKYDSKNGEWRLALKSTEEKINGIWTAFDSCFKASPGTVITAEQMLGKLMDPPFGMKAGPAPIFLCHYLLCKADEIAVFQETAYKPYLGAAEVFLLIKRPDLFSFKKVTEIPLHRAILERYRRIWKEAHVLEKHVRNRSLLGLVAPLLNFVRNLPHYTQHTHSISPMARKVLLTISNATDPVELLMEELPAAVDINITNVRDLSYEELDELSKRIATVLHELKDVYPSFIKRIEKELAQAFKVPDVNQLYAKIQPVAAELQYVCDDREMRAVLTTMATATNDVSQWGQRVASRMLRKPVDRWSDKDVEVFKEKAKDYAERIEQLRILTVQNRQLKGADLCLISVMLPGGYLNRVLVKDTGKMIDDQVRQIVDVLKRLAPEKAWAVVKELVMALAGGVKDESAAEQEREEGTPHPGIVGR